MPIKKLIELEKIADEFGFSWETSSQIMAQIRSECHEIEAHLDKNTQVEQQKLQMEIGDLLHAAFSLCHFNGFDAEETLTIAVNKFANRLEKVKMIAAEKGLNNLKGLPFNELMAIWDVAKLHERN